VDLRPRRSKGTFYSGIALFVHGGIALATGAVMVVYQQCSDEYPRKCTPFAPYALGIPVLANGAIALAVGIPLTVHGRARVSPSAMPAVDVQPARKSATLTWLF
jgi:hypothetical protein